MSHLTQTMLAMAGALAQQCGITLEIDPQATTFSVRGTHMRIPPIAKMMKRFPDMVDLESYIMGAVFHEAGHIRFTDRAVRYAFAMQYKGLPDPETEIARSIGQIIEDVVIERAQCGANAGGLRLFLKLWKLLFSKRQPRPLDHPDDGVFVDYVFARARHSVLQARFTQEVVDEMQQAFHARFAPEVVALYEQELETLDYIQTTADGAGLSTRLLSLFGIQPVVPEDEAEQEKQQAKTDAEAGDPSDQAPSEPAPDGQPEPGGPAEIGDGPEGAIPAKVDLATTDPLQLISVAVAELLDKEMQDNGEGNFLVLVPATGSGGDAEAEEFVNKHFGGLALKQRIQSHTMRASARLSTVLRAQTQCRVTYGKSGKVVGTRMWKLRTGNVNVFRKTEEGKALDTAIAMLLDRSKSMEDQLMQAVESVAFLPLALEGLPDIHSCIDMFPAAGKATQTLKSFDSRVTPSLDALASVKADGTTPMGEAIVDTGSRLLAQNVHRRILCVVTDGQPDNEILAKKAIRHLVAQGVEVVGIGIGQYAKNDGLFEDFIKLDSISQLTPAICAIMERKLLAMPMAA